MKKKRYERLIRQLRWEYTREFKVKRGDINRGECFVFAYLLAKLIPEAEIVGTENHCFVKIGRRYYDSDTPAGARSVGELYRNNGCIAWSYSITTRKTFASLRYWKRWGREQGLERWREREHLHKIIERVVRRTEDSIQQEARPA